MAARAHASDRSGRHLVSVRYIECRNILDTRCGSAFPAGPYTDHLDAILPLARSLTHREGTQCPHV